MVRLAVGSSRLKSVWVYRSSYTSRSAGATWPRNSSHLYHRLQIKLLHSYFKEIGKESKVRKVKTTDRENLSRVDFNLSRPHSECQCEIPDGLSPALKRGCLRFSIFK
jgi:hypothetical protein